MSIFDAKARRVRRFVLWWVFGWAVGLPILGCGFCGARLMGMIPNPSSFFNPAIAALDPGVKPFDQAKWDRGHAADRIAMGRWLADTGTLIGMRREELVTKLGPNNYESEHEEVQHLTWELGDLDDGGWFIRHMKLLVKIDKSGTVVDADIYSTD